VARQTSAAPPLPRAATLSHGVRSPKTAELVAGKLRRMVIDGQLKDGDFLPNETELSEQFHVSRPTLREAVRLLESDGLVEVRRGSRTGARVCVPGPEVVARPAALLLELSAATLADVMTARAAIEPMAAKLLAEEASEEAHDEFERLVGELPQAWADGTLAQVSANLHRRMVELSGNATLGIIAGMLHEIVERHTSAAVMEDPVPKERYDKLAKSFARLVDLVRSRDGRLAEAHWRRHMEVAGDKLLKGYADTRVRDIMD
jgi:GntR family transcriptional repressor for pyruvate dehydrogenase complex